MKQRKAVSEIVASLVLLMIISGLGTILYGFTLDVSQNQREKLVDSYQDSSVGLLEKVAVIDVWFDQSDDTLNITVFNFGEVEIEIDAVYVNSHPATDITSGLDTSILIQRLGEIILTSPIEIAPEDIIEIMIVTKRGYGYETSWKI